MKRSFPLFPVLIVFLLCWNLSAQAPADKAQGAKPAATAKPQADAVEPENHAMPETVTYGSGGDTRKSADPILDVPPMPKGNVTLVGGTVRKIDRVRNYMEVEPFGGKRMHIAFDERSHIYRDGTETTQLGIKKGDRVYVDTMLDKQNHRVFARNVRVENSTMPADARGQLVAFHSGSGVIEMRDELSQQPVTFKLDQKTTIKHNDQPATRAELMPGALIAVHFAPLKANRGLAQEINVYATPGSAFKFSGRLTHLDLRHGLLAVDNKSDGKDYEISFDPAHTSKDDLKEGAAVTVVAIFDGKKYVANSVEVNGSAEE